MRVRIGRFKGLRKAIEQPRKTNTVEAGERKLNTQPTYTPVYASLNASRRFVQNSGPSRSLILTRETLPFSTSCRFIPAHRTYTSKLSSMLGTQEKAREGMFPGLWLAVCYRFLGN
jgi:hypothetical protein